MARAFYTNHRFEYSKNKAVADFSSYSIKDCSNPHIKVQSSRLEVIDSALVLSHHNLRLVEKKLTPASKPMRGDLVWVPSLFAYVYSKQ